jgi:hypothetical protein
VTSIETHKNTDRGSSLYAKVAKELGCHDQQSGTWALTIEQLQSYQEPDNGESFKGQIRITRFLNGQPEIFADIEGATELGHNEGTGFAWGIYSMTTPNARYFDYDGDGVDELVLTVNLEGHESEPGSLVRIFTFKNGKIDELDIPTELAANELRDVDGDNRPDLILDSPFSTSIPCTLSAELHGPALIAHALPNGTFSINDSVALDYLKKQCPSKPTLKKVPTNNIDAYGKLLLQSACALFWGAAPSAVHKQILSPPKGEGCRYEDNDVEEWLNTKVPVTLQ